MSTKNDEKVLNAILNPNTPFEEDAQLNNESKYDESSSEISQAKELEVKVQMTEEELMEAHRKKKKALTGKIQALKKSITKGDKKKKKEVDAQIAQLEEEFSKKCDLELVQLKTQTSSVINVEQPASSEQSEQTEDKKKKSSKAQKRRDKKDKENEEREKLISQQEIENLKGPAHIELTKIKEKLKNLSLEIKEVRADGNCMFYAVSDQLNQHLNIEKSIKELRTLTCNYMLDKSEEFQPYLCCEETGDPFSRQEYEEYCNKLLDCLAPVWGSMTELKALSDLLKVTILVIQAEGSEIIIGDDKNQTYHDTKLVITYHRQMFGSGEHYNSTCSIRKNDEF